MAGRRRTTSTCPWFNMGDALASARARSVELRRRLPVPADVTPAMLRTFMSSTRADARMRDGVTWAEADELAVRVLKVEPARVWPDFDAFAELAGISAAEEAWIDDVLAAGDRVATAA